MKIENKMTWHDCHFIAEIGLASPDILLISDDDRFDKFYNDLYKEGLETNFDFIEENRMRLKETTQINWAIENAQKILDYANKNRVHVYPFSIVRIGESLDDIYKIEYDGKNLTDHKGKVVFD